MFSNGNGVEKSDKESFKWLEKSANNDNAIAQYNLGIYLAEGKGVEQDLEESYFWLLLASSHDYEGAADNAEYMESLLTSKEAEAVQQRATEFLTGITSPTP